jgi:hypothetical protein
MQQKFNVGFCTFSYGGNGGISSEVPNIREWMVPLVADLSRDARVDQIRVWNLADTPITMTRNRAVLMAREYGVDCLVMVDSDMHPDVHAGSPDAKPFFKTSFDFFVDHYSKGPCVIGAPYCGPPPVECVYVFRWQNMQSAHPAPDFQLEMYDRHTAVKMAGIQECAALPTGLIMYDMRAFELTEPKTTDDKPWFYYEWKDHFASEKASTEDVTMTRDLSLVGTQKLGYNPVYCNWDAWAGHWKPKCVGKPQVIEAAGVAAKLRGCWEAKVEAGVKLCDISPPKWLAAAKKAQPFDDLGMGLPDSDADALRRLIGDFHARHQRYPVVCEVGSWAGRSAMIMADAGATVHCVDHWQGNKHDDGCCGVDSATAHRAFLDNTKAHREAGLIQYFLGSSEEAASYYSRLGVFFDIVYIDAEHTYEAVKKDIALWKPLAVHLLAGHDYKSFPGVAKAVNETGTFVAVDGNVWRVTSKLVKP